MSTMTTIKIGLPAILRKRKWQVAFFELASAALMARWHASNLLNLHLLRLDYGDLVLNIEAMAAYRASPRTVERPKEMIPEKEQLQSFLARVQSLICKDSKAVNPGKLLCLINCRSRS
jgi:hypothetical protein